MTLLRRTSRGTGPWPVQGRSGTCPTFLILFLALAACRSTPTRPSVRIAIGGAEQIVYLPTTLAQQLGYYEAEGVQVQFDSFPGGAKALQALLGGSADVVSGFYEHTIQMAAEGRSLKAFVLMLRYPGLVAVAAPGKGINRIEDLKGRTAGVTAPGSSTHMLLNHLLASRGLAPADVSVTGIGGSSTAVASVERGVVDAAVVTDPALAMLQKRTSGGLTILADTRTAAGVKSVFGSSVYPASVLYADAAWLGKNPDTARRLASAIQRTLQWIQQHSPQEIAEKMPPSHRGDDLPLYVEALRNSMQMFSPDGRMEAEGPEAVKRVLAGSLEKVRNSTVDPAATYTNEFIK